MLGLLEEARSTGARDGHAEGRNEGRNEGRVEATRRHLLRALERRQLAIGDAERARITAAADPDLLDRWFERALTAASVAEVFRDDP